MVVVPTISDTIDIIDTTILDTTDTTIQDTMDILGLIMDTMVVPGALVITVVATVGAISAAAISSCSFIEL